MDIPEAIAILAAKKRDDVERRAADSAEACQLGIEALKRIANNRTGKYVSLYDLLPGETKE